MNDGTMLSLGHQYDSTSSPVQFNPAGYTLGTGKYSPGAKATLTLATTVTLSDGCTFMRNDSSTVMVLGDNMLSVDWTHRENNFGTFCVTSDEPPTDPCTSELTFTLGM
jgi:hypothetical protein